MVLTHLALFSFFDGAGTAAVAPVVADVVKTGTGGIDPGEGLRRRRTIVKPTGLVDRPRREVERRIEQADEVAREVTREMRERFVEEPKRAPEVVPPISAMSIAEIDAEIGRYLRELQVESQRTEDDELMILLLMVN
jgi:hypothetical protein